MPKARDDEWFDPSGSIAEFIAAALQHPNPPCNGGGLRMSTIRVDQHKNKFDQVIVYCELADQNLVSEAWADGSNGNGPPSDDFKVMCLAHDAWVYRRTYRKMLFLVPSCRDTILGRPDYGYLLFDTVDDLDAWLSKLSEPRRYLQRWQVASVEELRAALHKIYKRWY